MNVRLMRLALGLFFLVAGAAVLVVRFAVPDVAAKMNPERLLLGGSLALVLAGWNLARWYASLPSSQPTTPGREPLRPNPRARGEDEYNPEFDFGKQDEGQ